MLFLFLRLLFISCHFGLSVCKKNVTFLITKRQFISAKTCQMPGQEVREWRMPPHRNLYSDATKTRGFYLLTRQVCEQHRAIVESSAGAVKETSHGSRDTGEMAWSVDVSALGETKLFQFDGGEHKQDRLSNGSNLQGGERHLNKSALCHPTAPFLHHRICFSQSTVRILGSL